MNNSFTIYDNIQLAQRFLEIAEKFYWYAQKNKTILDFAKGSVTKEPCGTIACHGGFGAIILLKKYIYFTKGAEAIAEYLGFLQYHTWDDDIINARSCFKLWAAKNPEIWGNKFGHNMFSADGYLAFGFTHTNGHKITLLDIAQQYVNVANRLLQLGVKK